MPFGSGSGHSAAPPSASICSTAGLVIGERLVLSDATNAGWQRDLFVSRISQALVFGQQGDGHAALEYAQAGLRIIERLAVLDPSNATWRNDLSWCRGLVARLSRLSPAA